VQGNEKAKFFQWDIVLQRNRMKNILHNYNFSTIRQAYIMKIILIYFIRSCSPIQTSITMDKIMSD